MIKDLGAGDPAVVGPYRLLGRLGVGGMGQVYLAKSPGGRLVAIKLIRPDLAEERGFRSRFASEISAAKNVSGIYTAAVVDADADAEHPWMATVYVPGPSLTDAVDDNGPLPVRSVLALAAGLAEALQAIHRAGLVHRDLKPSNVLLAADGPRVIDFGISLALERSMMTATGMVMGSPGFMSPEQARGQREVGAPTDVFSLGAVLAFAATGNGPFGGGPVSALLYRVVNEPPDLAAVPPELTSLIGQCLAKDPAGRPTPAELLERLSGEVGVLTGEWLPRPVTEAMHRYTPTLQTPAAPAVPASGPSAPSAAPSGAASSGAASSAPPGAAAPAAPGLAPTEIAPAGPAAGVAAAGLGTPPLPAGSAVPPTVPEPAILPETSVVAMPGAITEGRDFPGGTAGQGGAPPGGPPPRRRWLWVAAAAAAAAVIAVVAVLLTVHSPTATPGTGTTPTASLDGSTTPAPTRARPSLTPTPAQSAASAPVTQPATTATAPSSAATTPATTTAPTSSATPTTSSTPTQSATQSAPASAPPGSPASSPGGAPSVARTP